MSNLFGERSRRFSNGDKGRDRQMKRWREIHTQGETVKYRSRKIETVQTEWRKLSPTATAGAGGLPFNWG